MIRLTYALRRKPGLSFAEFQGYWREQHGPLVASFAETLKIRKYIQVHALQDPENEQKPGPRGKMQKPYDGVAELWFDGIEDLNDSFISEKCKVAGAHLLEDEKNFIDHQQSPAWAGYECPQINPNPENIVAAPDSPINKLYFLLNHPAQQSFDAAQYYWRVSHGPLVRRFAGALSILRYLQVHRLDLDVNRLFAESRGTLVKPYYGHAELWTNQQTAGLHTPESKRGARALVEDEAKFINFAESCLWSGKEFVFVNRF